ncbi:hypothetical protein CFP56_010566 [Quercus suber]|uniref:Uncharacterized protein n=1 Tax=Quercus suber TaxID=58331 RepID=A0AAW0L305_QUESU
MWFEPQPQKIPLQLNLSLEPYLFHNLVLDKENNLSAIGYAHGVVDQRIKYKQREVLFAEIKQIKAATNFNAANKIREGGFGSVYKNKKKKSHHKKIFGFQILYNKRPVCSA